MSKKLSKAIIILRCILYCGTTSSKESLFISNGTDILLSEPETGIYSSVHKTNGSVGSLGCDSTRGFLFWSDLGQFFKGVYQSSVAPDGSLHNIKQLDLFDVMEVPSLAVDTHYANLFLINSRHRSIEVYNYLSGAQRVLMLWELSQPTSLALDMESKWLYWSDKGTNKIERSRFDASEREVVADNMAAQVIAVYDSNVLFVDPQKRLLKLQIQPKEISILYEGNNSYSGLSVHNNKAFMSMSGQIISIDLFDVRNINVIANNRGTNLLLNLIFFQHPTNPDARIYTVQSDCFGGMELYMSRNEVQCTCSSYGLKIPMLRSTRELAKRKILCAYGRARKILLFTSADDGIVGYKVLEPTFPQRSGLPFFIVGRSLRPVAVTFNPHTKEVFWSDVQEHSIHKAYLDATGHTILLSHNHDLGVVDGLTIDLESGNLYYTNIGSLKINGKEYSWNKIEVVNPSQPNIRRTVLDNADKPRALVALNYRRILYTNWGKKPSITELDMSGKWKTVHVAGLNNPNGIFVGDILNSNEIFLVDSHHKTRKKSNMHYSEEKSGNLQIFVAAEDTKYYGIGRKFIEAKLTLRNVQIKLPFGITGEPVNEGHEIYISDWYYKYILKLHVGKMDNTTYLGSSMEYVLDNIPSPMGLFLTSITPPSTIPIQCFCGCENDPLQCGTSVCMSVWLSFSLPRPPSLKNKPFYVALSNACGCNSYGMKMLDRNNRCYSQDDFVLFADLNGIKMVKDSILSEKDDSVHTVHSDMPLYSNCVALTFDHGTQNMFFSDVDSQSIYKKNMADGRVNRLYHNVVSEGMTIVGNRLFWTDCLNGRIQSMEQNGSDVQLHVTGLEKPRAICYMQGAIFWTELGKKGRVAKLSLNILDQEPTVVWDEDLVWPNALFCDDSMSRVYVGDAFTKVILVCIFKNPISCKPLKGLPSKPKHIYGLWVLESKYLYYSDWEEGTVVSMVLGTGVGKIIAQGVRPSQIYVHLPSFPTGYRYRCSHMIAQCDECIAYPSAEMCTCSPGLKPKGELGLCEKAEVPWLLSDDYTCDATCNDHTQCMRQVSSTQYTCLCKAGKGTMDDACKECDQNFYKERPNPEACVQCPDGSFTQAGSDTCDCFPPLAWDGTKKRCIDTKEEKTGECPTSIGSFYQQCISYKPCQADYECPGAQKCCSLDNCGQKCLDPIAQDICIYEGKIYLSDELFYPNDCTKCQCITEKSPEVVYDPRFGGASCEVTDCPSLECSKGVILLPGVCCSICNESSLFHMNIINCPPQPVSFDLPPHEEFAVHHWEAHVVHNLILKPFIKVKKTPKLNIYHWLGNNSKPYIVKSIALMNINGVNYESEPCVFKVFVRDVTAPEIHCTPDFDILVTLTNPKKDIPNVKVYDTVEVEYPIISNLSKITEPGTFIVSHIVKDKAGNEASCLQNISAKVYSLQSCSSVPEIFNGVVVCQPYLHGDNCSVQCMLGYAMMEEAYNNMVCQHNEWTPKFDSKEVQSLSCLAYSYYKVIGEMYIKYLKCNAKIIRDVSTNYLQTQFDAYLESRIKDLHLKVRTEEYECMSNKVDSGLEEYMTGVTFVITVFYKQKINENATDKVEYINNIMTKMQIEIKQGWFTLEIYTQDKSPKIMEPSFISLTLKSAEDNSCFQGELVTSDGCLECPKGSYHNGEKCVLCEANTYQNMDGQLQCIPCDHNHISQPGSYHRSHCTKLATNVFSTIASALTGTMLLFAIFLGLGVFVYRRCSFEDEEKNLEIEDIGTGNDVGSKVHGTRHVSADTLDRTISLIEVSDSVLNSQNKDAEESASEHHAYEKVV